MVYGIDLLTRYYGAYDEDGRLASRHGQVEYLTTMRYIDRCLQPGMRVLEIGAGTGRYTHTLARRGYTVDAVELMEKHIALFNANTEPGESVAIRQGSATDLFFYGDEVFDLVLMLGPMYHLFRAEDQKRALSEALRVLKPGGLLYTAYCVSDASIIGFGFKSGHVFDLVEKGLLDTETFTARSTPEELFQLYRKEDVDALMAPFNTTRLHYVATDLFTNHMRETVDAMDDKTFSLYLQYHFFLCERPDMAGLTHHSLDIVQKPVNLSSL